MDARKVDVRLPGKGNSNSRGARPVHLIITMMKWIRTSRLSMNNYMSGGVCSGLSLYRDNNWPPEESSLWLLTTYWREFSVFIDSLLFSLYRDNSWPPEATWQKLNGGENSR